VVGIPLADGWLECSDDLLLPARLWCGDYSGGIDHAGKRTASAVIRVSGY
jgi:hypothetical protein